MHSQLLREGWPSTQIGPEDEEKQTRQSYFPTLDEIVSLLINSKCFV